jgi:hypothetical protein
MVDERAPVLARELTAHGPVLRQRRIFARLRERWAYDEVATQERLTAETARQIVRQALKKQIIEEGADHAKLQLARLQPATRARRESDHRGHKKFGARGRRKSLKRLDSDKEIKENPKAFLWLFMHFLGRIGLISPKAPSHDAERWARLGARPATRPYNIISSFFSARFSSILWRGAAGEIIKGGGPFVGPAARPRR